MEYYSLPDWVRRALRKDARWGYMAYKSMDEVPQVFTYQAEFTTTAQDQSPIVLQPDQAVPSDMYIQEFGYDVMRPNFAPGSVLKAQSDLANASQPGIKVLLEVGGGFLGDQYNINIGLSPIQMVIPNIRQLGQSGCAWPGKWFMSYSQELIIECFLSRNLATTEVPYQVAVAMHAKRITCPGFSEMSVQDCKQRLEDEEGLRNLPMLQLNPNYDLSGLGANPSGGRRPSQLGRRIIT